MFDLSAQGASLSCPTARGLLHIEFCYILNFPAFPLVLKQKLLWGKRQSNCLSLRAVFCCCVLPENLELQRMQAHASAPCSCSAGKGPGQGVDVGTRSAGERGSAGEQWDLPSPTIPRAGWHGPAGVSAAESQRLGTFPSQTWTQTLLKWVCTLPLLAFPPAIPVSMPSSAQAQREPRDQDSLQDLVPRPGRAVSSSCPLRSSSWQPGQLWVLIPSLLPPWKWIPTLAQHISISFSFNETVAWNTKQLLCLLQINKTGTNYVHSHFPCFLYKSTN